MFSFLKDMLIWVYLPALAITIPTVGIMYLISKL